MTNYEMNSYDVIKKQKRIRCYVKQQVGNVYKKKYRFTKNNYIARFSSVYNFEKTKNL